MSKLIDDLKENNICVYGCGEYGLQTYLFLRDMGIAIDFFSDRDILKKGYVVDGVFCITSDELLQRDKKNIVLIVAIAYENRLVKEFRELGFEKVYYYEEVKRLLNNNIAKVCVRHHSMKVEEAHKLKQQIEEITFRKDISMERKRDSILNLTDER